MKLQQSCYIYTIILVQLMSSVIGFTYLVETYVTVTTVLFKGWPWESQKEKLDPIIHVANSTYFPAYVEEDGFNKGVRSCPKLSIIPFNESQVEPSNIQSIHPKDIKAVLALGDSITAGCFANTTNYLYPGDCLEMRGQCYSTGGDSNAVTLYNFFYHYNGMQLGPSNGARYVRPHFLLDYMTSWGYNVPEMDGFNAAMTGATSSQLEAQIDYLIGVLRQKAGDGIFKQWKLITLFIGANDVCGDDCLSDFPLAGKKGDPLLFEKNLISALEKIRLSLPYSIVNIIQLFDISCLTEWTNAYPERCDSSKWLRFRCCPCLGSEEGRQRLKRRVNMLNYIIEKTADTYRIYQDQSSHQSISWVWLPFLWLLDIYTYVKLKLHYTPFVPKYQDFAIIVNSTFKGLNLSELFPIDFLSQADCFHPGILANQVLSSATWNDFYIPHYKKTQLTHFPFELYCPSDDDVIYVI